jgi:aryl-alcohol dehydrogenase-like predicted oxidoreductase
VLSRGLLSGSKPTGPRDFRAHLPRFRGDNGAHNQRLVDALARLAAPSGASTPVAAGDRVGAREPGRRAHHARRSAPAPGPSSPTSLAALEVTLDAAEVAALEDAVPAHAIAGTRYAAPQMQHLDSER